MAEHGDLVRMAIGSLGRQPVRTLLTVLGVAVGTFALVSSLSAGQGLDRLILGLFRGSNALRQITVFLDYQPAAADPTYLAEPLGDVTDAARKRRLELAREHKAPRQGGATLRASLDLAAIAQLGRLPHVEQVSPVVSLRGRAQLPDSEAAPIAIELASADPQERYRTQLVAGRPVSEAEPLGVVVHEYLLYRLGLTRDAAATSAIGRTIRFEHVVRRNDGPPSLARVLSQTANGFPPAELRALRSLLGRLGGLLSVLPLPAEEQAALQRLRQNLDPEAELPGAEHDAETFTIIGLMREKDAAETKLRQQDLFGHHGQDAEILMAPRAAAAFALRSPKLVQSGLNNAMITVDQMANVGPVITAVEALGFRTNSLIRIIETVRMNVMLVSLATAFIALVALAVAALGITNTMIMSVLERTHEIGVMKAVGARDGQVRTLFLIEGAAIGLLGGALGVALAWLAAIPGDAVARSIIRAQVDRPVTDSMFAFPPWLVLGAPLVAVLITTLAALYPANRAARIDPIVALRHD